MVWVLFILAAVLMMVALGVCWWLIPRKEGQSGGEGNDESHSERLARDVLFNEGMSKSDDGGDESF